MGIIGVIPAAGHATRLQPLSGSKEVVPVGGVPVMEYLMRRMRAAGCTELRVVTRPEKEDVVAYARRAGATVVLDRPETVSESFAAGMRGAADDDVVLLGFPDTIWKPEGGFVPLVRALERGWELALGLFEIEELARSDVVAFDELGGIAGIEVKPVDPPSGWIWGCAAARAGSLRRLTEDEQPGVHFDRLCRDGVPVCGIRLSNVWLDIGTPEALERAGGFARATVA